MSVVVGMMCEGRPYLAADSWGTDGSETCRHTAPKVWRDGDLLFGVTGTQRLAQVIRYCVTAPPCAEYVLLWLVRCYVPALKAAVAEHGGTEKDGDLDGSILIGHVSGLYRIDSGYGVVPLELPYEALGSGSSYALGALYDTPTPPQLPDLRRAVEAGIFFDIYCGGPVVVVGFDEPRAPDATAPSESGPVAREGTHE